ncbi:MAG: M23 family metallopeptidase [Alphaproteobacteria bacterium]|nr:M23 family metallopeptidase [Alphaproteobacteria bacterium]
MRTSVDRVFILIGTSFLVLLSGCARDEAPSEVVQIRRPSPYHAVKKDETIADIARQHGMKEDELIQLNKLNPEKELIPGKRLLVHPRDSGAAESVEKAEGDVSVRHLDDKVTSDKEAPHSDEAPKLGEQKPGEGGEEPPVSISPKAESAAPAPEKAAMPQAAAATTTYEWPVKGDIIQKFGQKLPDGSLNEGINISAPANLPVKAVADGVVKDAGSRIKAYGNMVVLKHPDGKLSIYAHLQEIAVKQPATGEAITVTKGQVIGRIGKSGIAKKPQLYFQIRGKDLKPIDPTTILPQ